MISVIIGVYNYKHFTNLYSVLDSITNQKNVKEIIISDNSKTETANIKKICKRFGVKYIFAKISPTGGNIGLSRNMAAKMAKGKFLYFTDADVILYDKRYFIKLLNIINKNQKYILMQPSMYRVKRGKEKLKSDFIQYKTKINFNFDGGCFYNYKNLNFIPVKEKEKIEAYQDVFSSPTYIWDVAENMGNLLTRSGSVHLSGMERFSRYEFLRRIVEGLNLSVTAVPIAYDSQKVVARRPKDTTLESLHQLSTKPLNETLNEMRRELR